MVVSILAGVEVASLRATFWTAGGIVRALPNLPVAVRRGVVALYGDELPGEVRDELSSLFVRLGYAIGPTTEAQLAAIGSVAGAGPAYVARFIDALAKAGEARSLAETASTIALETVLGTAWMAASTARRWIDVVRRVASPNGTTEAGLAVLGRDDVLDQLVALTICGGCAAGRGTGPGSQGRQTCLRGPRCLVAMPERAWHDRRTYRDKDDSRLAFEPSAKPVPAEERAKLLIDPGFGRVFTDHMAIDRI